MSDQGDLFVGQPPSFAPTAAQVRAERIGVVDVGSNSVRMVVFEGHCRSPAVVFNEKVMCGLGARLRETGVLDPQGKVRAMKALRRFAALAPSLNVGALSGIGTAAIRDAEDGPNFRAEIARATGIRLKVASGEDEARLAAKGVLFGNPRAEGVVIDLGGASLEFARVRAGRVINGMTTPLGPLRLNGELGSDEARDAEILSHINGNLDPYRLDGGTLYLVGGSWRALARIAMIRQDYPVEVIHEFEMTADEARKLCDWTMKASPERIAAMPGVSSNRAPMLPLAGRLLAHVMDALRPNHLMISTFGLREGVCLDNLPQTMRGEDPLIAACKELEQRRARAPGFGAELFSWARQIMPPESPQEARLMRAACLLADVNWRTHPDFRDQGCWETVTRTTITDIGHAGRVWLGAVLVIRYKARGRRKLGQMDQMALLSDEELERAARFGSILRLGGVLSGNAPGVLTQCRAEVEKDVLHLTLTPEIGTFFGEEVEKRLLQAARALDLETKVTIGETQVMVGDQDG